MKESQLLRIIVLSFYFLQDIAMVHIYTRKIINWPTLSFTFEKNKIFIFYLFFVFYSIDG
jgi:hypothetical protein